jgi:hypothetical protein
MTRDIRPLSPIAPPRRRALSLGDCEAHAGLEYIASNPRPAPLAGRRSHSESEASLLSAMVGAIEARFIETKTEVDAELLSLETEIHALRKTLPPTHTPLANKLTSLAKSFRLVAPHGANCLFAMLKCRQISEEVSGLTSDWTPQPHVANYAVKALFAMTKCTRLGYYLVPPPPTVCSPR